LLYFIEPEKKLKAEEKPKSLLEPSKPEEKAEPVLTRKLSVKSKKNLNFKFKR
jgi:hypothetical protein